MEIRQIRYERWNPLPFDQGGEKIELSVDVPFGEDPAEVLATMRVWLDRQLEMTPAEVRAVIDDQPTRIRRVS